MNLSQSVISRAFAAAAFSYTTLFAFSAQATFVPENEIRYDALTVGDPQISEAQFRELIGNITNRYSGIVSNLGGKLSITGDWKSETLNAGATQMFGLWRVQITGGLARRPELTPDGFTLIVCHELGHHIGGFAYASAPLPIVPMWAAAEGQADYFSTQVCARELWASENDKNASYKNKIEAYPRSECDAAWNNEADRNICYRTVAAIDSLTKTMGGILNKPAPKFETPDLSKVDKTSDKHPAIQCRMDTTFQAALCTAKFDEKLIPGKSVADGPNSLEAEKEAAAHSCMAYSGYTKGLRPSCWFKPGL